MVPGFPYLRWTCLSQRPGKGPAWHSAPRCIYLCFLSWLPPLVFQCRSVQPVNLTLSRVGKMEALARPHPPSRQRWVNICGQDCWGALPPALLHRFDPLFWARFPG